MLHQLQKSIIMKPLWGFMSLYILNCCIDAPTSHFAKEDISINKQESILELIIEKILGFDNAVAEYDDCDTDTSVKKNITIDIFIAPTIIVTIQKKDIHPKKKEIIRVNHKALTPFFEIHSPPPEA